MLKTFVVAFVVQCLEELLGGCSVENDKSKVFDEVCIWKWIGKARTKRHGNSDADLSKSHPPSAVCLTSFCFR